MNIKKTWIISLGTRVFLVLFSLQVCHYAFSQMNEIWFNTVAPLDDVRAALDDKHEKHNLDARDSFGLTGLMLACMNGNADLVDLLLKHGASPHLKSPGKIGDAPFDKGGNTALHYAVYFATANTDAAYIITQLLAHGARVNVRNGNGDAPIHYILQIPMLREGERQSVLRQFLDHNADINAQNYGNKDKVYTKRLIGDTMLHISAENNEVEWIMQLKSVYGSMLNFSIKNSEGLTAARRAIVLGLGDLTGVFNPLPPLIGTDGHVNATDSQGRTGLMLATIRGDLEFARRQIKQGANVNAVAPDDRNNTALHYACFSERYSLELVQLLLDNHANVNARNTNGDTPLSLAAKLPMEVITNKGLNARDAIVRLLVGHGAKL